MTEEEVNRLTERISDEFDAVTDNGNNGSALFWDIHIIADLIFSELRQSYTANRLTRAEFDGLKEFFNTHMEKVANIHLKEGD